MLNFVLNLQTYVTNEVIEPNWHTLMTTLKNVQNIDEGKKFEKIHWESLTLKFKF